MQFDMHYYGTFAMAHAAGLDTPHAQIVATSAQLVDDNNLTKLHELASGQGVQGVATAHHPLEAGQRALNLGSEDDSRLIWVPFHFLPGAEGQTFADKVICVKDSATARKMVAYYTKKESVDSHRGHCLQLMGIAAHVYADTFSHYGFSGVPSPLNQVDFTTIELSKSHGQKISAYLKGRAKQFMDTVAAAVGGTAILGHGAVTTYPDRPFLKWSYLLPNGKRLHRDNPATFMEACKALHNMFSDFQKVFYTSGVHESVPFESIEKTVQEILATEADAEGRVNAWKKALKAGHIGKAVDVPEYSATDWIESLTSAKELVFDPSKNRVNNAAYGFFAAADYHRNYVLKRLLPEHGLFVA